MKSATTLLLSLLIFSGIAHAVQERVYFGTSNSPGIYFADLDSETGELSSPILAAKIENPGFIALHPNGHYLYSTTGGFEKPNTGGVAAYKITADGTLTLINKQPSEGIGPCHVSVDFTGTCLVVANYGSGSVAALKILDDGSLAPSTSVHNHEGSGTDPKRQKKPHPHSAFISPGNTHVYVPDLGIDKVMIYKLDADKAQLTPTGSATVPGSSQGPRHMKFSSEGSSAYVLNELALNVANFAHDETSGALTYKSSTETLPNQTDKEAMSCAEIRIHSNGKFVYSSNRDLKRSGRDAISVFEVTANKDLNLIETVSAEVSIPRNFNIDPSGKWIVVGGQKSKNIAIFAIDPTTGRLEFTGTTIPFEGEPICIEFQHGPQ
jgi:6-phosphogluconolactonase